MNEIISTKNAPSAIGPYSQAVKAGNLLFISGQIPVDPATGEVVEATIQAQTTRSLNNLKAILERYRLNRIIFRQRIPWVDQHQLPCTCRNRL